MADIFTTDEHGQVLEKLTGYWLRVIGERPAYPLADELAQIETRDEQRLRSILEGALPQKARQQIGIALGRMRAHSLPRQERHRLARPIFVRALRVHAPTRSQGDKGRPPSLHWLSTGKPYIENAAGRRLDVSIAHDDTTCLCVVGAGPVGCDWLPIQGRAREDWRALLNDANLPLLEALVAAGDSVDVAGARIWCAIEAVRKATQAGDVALTLARRIQDVVYLRAANLAGHCRWYSRNPSSSPARRSGRSHSRSPVMEPEAEPVTQGIDPAWHCVSVAARTAHWEQPVQQMRFLVSFQEAADLNRRVSASRRRFWMGKMRELVTSSQVPQNDRARSPRASGAWSRIGPTFAWWARLGERCYPDAFLDDAAPNFPRSNSAATSGRCCPASEISNGWLSFSRQATWVRLVGHGRVGAARPCHTWRSTSKGWATATGAGQRAPSAA